MPDQGTQGEGIEVGAHCTYMWTTQPWFPVLQTMAVREPVMIPLAQDLVLRRDSSSNNTRIESSRVASVRKSHDSEGILDAAVNLILVS